MLVLHVAKLTSVADYFVLCSGESERQVRAIAEGIDATLSAQRTSPLSIEGGSTAKWIVMDFGDVVVHIFYHGVRDHYALEKLWADAKAVRIPGESPPEPAKERRPAKPRTSRVSRRA